ncbi:hypothetical protein L6R29_10325 [Myxococcota bacterium]|nr:hypothetical protein [Myxococcota bacterium]
MSHNKPPKHLGSDVQRLKQKAGWDPAKHVRADAHEQLRGLDQEIKNQKVYAQADSCPACLLAQQESNDPSALCDTHLQQALGF